MPYVLQDRESVFCTILVWHWRHQFDLSQVYYARSECTSRKLRSSSLSRLLAVRQKSLKPRLKSSHSKEWSISNFPYSLARNITSRSMKNLAFHSLLGSKIIILPINSHHITCTLGECTFWTWEWKFDWQALRVGEASAYRPSRVWGWTAAKVWRSSALSLSQWAQVET